MCIREYRQRRVRVCVTGCVRGGVGGGVRGCVGGVYQRTRSKLHQQGVCSKVCCIAYQVHSLDPCF